MNVKMIKDTTVTAAELSQWLGISPQAIGENARKGTIARAPARGRYLLRASIKGYVERLRAAAAGRDGPMEVDRTRLLKSQADRAETKARKLAATYLDASEVESTFKAMRRRVLKILAGIPDECVKKLPSLTEHDIGQIEQEVTLATAPLAADEPKKGE